MKNKKLTNKTLFWLAAAAALSLLTTQGALAQKKYDTGASDTEIKIGNVEAYSGPASAYGVIGKTEDAYFKMINDQGGVNGRKINFISYDDGDRDQVRRKQGQSFVLHGAFSFVGFWFSRPRCAAGCPHSMPNAGPVDQPTFSAFRPGAMGRER